MSFKQKNVNNSNNNNTVNNINNSKKTNVTNISTNVTVGSGNSNGGDSWSNELILVLFIAMLVGVFILARSGFEFIFQNFHKYGSFLFGFIATTGIIATSFIYIYSKRNIKNTIYAAIQTIVTPILFLTFLIRMKLPESVTTFLNQVDNKTIFDFTSGTSTWTIIFLVIFPLILFLLLFLIVFNLYLVFKKTLFDRRYIGPYVFVLISIIFIEIISNFS